MTSPDDRVLRVDRATRTEILNNAGYKCQLNYTGCTVTATELAHTGSCLKAACKDCRRQRDTMKQRGNRAAAAAMRRTRR
jgi:hypothetical protein